ncbi:MAG: type II toxin-antitoxin system VapB family antitoxin [Nocardioides sp.]
MSLNIKNERVHALAREAARLTGQTQTRVIEEALERLLAGLDDQGVVPARRLRIDTAVGELHAAMSDGARAAMSATEAELYDDVGLPR